MRNWQGARRCSAIVQATGERCENGAQKGYDRCGPHINVKFAGGSGEPHEPTSAEVWNSDENQARVKAFLEKYGKKEE